MRLFLSSLLVCAAVCALALGARAQLGVTSAAQAYPHLPPHSAMRFEVGAPAATDALPVTTTATGTPIVLPVEQPTTVAQRDAFVGTYKAAAPCTPSATCCCALDGVTIKPGTTANTLNLEGPSDGGAGCMGQTSMAGAFTMSDPLSAYAHLSFVPVLIQLQTESTHEWLQLNSTRTNCNNVFQRVPQNPLQQIGGVLANPTPEGLGSVINDATAQLPAVGSAVAAPQVPAVTGAVVQPDGSLQLPATTLGTGSSALNLPSTTLPAPGGGAGPFGAVGQQQMTLPAFPQVGAVQQAALPTGQVADPSALPAANLNVNAAPVLPANPFANTQSTASSAAASFPPVGSSMQLPTLNAQLPNLGAVGSNPFQINSLQAVPVPVLPGSTASATDAGAQAQNANPLGQLPQVGQQVQLPQVGQQIQMPQVGQQIQMPQIGSNLNGPLGALPGSTGQVGAVSNTPIGSATTQLPGGATLPGVATLPGGATLPVGNLPGANNPFAAAASSSTAGGVTFTPLLLEMSDSGASPDTKNYMAAFIAPASADLGVVILHYYTMSDMRQKNVYMNRTQNSELAAQLTSAAGPALAPGSAYAMYAHGPISVGADDQLTYSYTFAKMADGAGAANSPSYAYPSAAQPVGSVRAVRVPAAAITELGLPVSSDVGEQASSSSVDLSSPWNGAFQVDSQCVPGDSCCCGVGLLNVSATAGRPDEVLLSGQLDGGAGCLYQTSLTGIMAVNASNPRQASRSIEIPNNEKTVITFVAQLEPTSGDASASSSADLSQLTIFNTFRSCQTHATKVAAFQPDATVDDSVDPEETILTPNATAASNDTELPRDAFVGDYTFDESCVPSASCCCAVGELSIAPVYEWTTIPPLPAGIAGTPATSAGSRDQQVILNANLDGGSACVGMQNVSQAFLLSGPTAASFNMPPVTLNASLDQSKAGAGLDTLTFSNSLYPGCLSRAHKKSNIKQHDVAKTNETKVEPVDPVPTVPLLTTEEFTALRDSLVGEYEPSGCVPSAECCCAVGRTKVTANETSPMLVNVDTKLQGDVHMTFTLLNATSAEAQPFGAVNVKFMAAMHNDTSNKFVVSNTVHPACPTTMVKVALQQGGAAPRSHNAPLLVALVAFAVAAIMRRA